MFPLILAVLAMEDGDVLARLQRREPQALAELYDRYGGMVYRLALRIVRDSGIAEDLVQETFLRAWTARDTFRSDCSLATWLIRIALNLARDHTRTGRFRFWKSV